MEISVSNTFTHEAQCARKVNTNQDELRDVVVNAMKKIGVKPDQIKLTDDGRVELEHPSDLKLHTLMLKMEELGLNMKMTKQTLIEIN